MGVLLSGSACGDDAVGGDVTADADIAPDATDPCAPPPAPEGLLSSVDELDVTACDLPTLAQFDPDNLWYVHNVAFGGGVVRLRRDDCGRVVSDDGRYVASVDGGVFMRSEFRLGQNVFTGAVYVCAAGSSADTWFGVSRSCRPLEGEVSCSDGAFEMEPFGWIEGDVESEGIELVGEWAGGSDPWTSPEVKGVRVRDGVAYLAAGRYGLRVVDVSDPTAPRDLAYRQVQNDNLNDIEMVDHEGKRYVLLASQSEGVLVYDVTAPAEPTLVRVLPFGVGIERGVHRMFLAQRDDGSARLYLVDGGSAMVAIWDVTDPQTASHIGLFTTDDGGGFHDLYVENDHMYINDMFGDRFLVVDATAPFDAVVLGQTTNDPRTRFSHSAWVTRVGDRTLAAVGNEGGDTTIAMVDVDPDSPEFMAILGGWKLRPLVSAHHLVARGNRVYVTHYMDGLRVLDISDPTAPTQVAFFNTWNRQIVPNTIFGAYDLTLSDEFIYVVDSSRGLLILRETP